MERTNKGVVKTDQFKNERLLFVIHDDGPDELKKYFDELRESENFNTKDFKIEVMLCIWYAIEMEKLYHCQVLFKLDPIIDKIIKSLRTKGHNDIQLHRAREAEKLKR